MVEDKPFRTESCGDCSHFEFDGETPICYGLEMITDHCSEPLTPKQALEYYGPNGDFCSKYDGKIPHTLEEIQNYISERPTKK